VELTYFSLGAQKRLNEIVMAGSHDAGITAGAANVQTQAQNILGQAISGSRVFDIRIKAVGTRKSKELKTYHGSAKDPATESKKGAWGDSLTTILNDAVTFVRNPAFSNEFLILKFDHCSSWIDIARTCVDIAGPGGANVLYTGGGNINNKTLQELRGKVIVAFMQAGYNEVRRTYDHTAGIVPIRKVPDDGAYDPNFNGLQYCGKGGTNWKKGGDAKTKVKENYDKQQTRFRKGLGDGGSPDVLGMMYWTTTGLLGSIRARNDEMWDPHGPYRNRLDWMFHDSLAESIQDRIAKSVDPTNYAFGTVLKVYMPNIIMIDFADNDKCKTVFDLNTLAATELTQTFKQLDEAILQRRLREAEKNRKQSWHTPLEAMMPVSQAPGSTTAQVVWQSGPVRAGW
jgi:hypothetical protein